MVEEINQEVIDREFPKIKAEWDRLVEESGRSEPMFIALDTTGVAAGFLGRHKEAQDAAREAGLILPDLVDGLTVTFE